MPSRATKSDRSTTHPTNPSACRTPTPMSPTSRSPSGPAREVPEEVDDPDQPLRLVEPDVLVDSDLLDQVDDDGDIAEPD